MREILFKAKRVDNGEWVYGLLNQYQGKFLICIEIIEHPTFSDPAGTWIYKEHEVYPHTVCQFTGLRDKNGNKIFEGDKCKDQFNRIMQVVYHNFRLKFECISSGDSDHWKYADFIDWCKYQGAEITNNCRVEITGNIHN